MPEIYFGEWLISALFEIGPTEMTDMGGMQPVRQSEIAAYAINHAIEWDSWEVTALRSLSSAYASSRIEGKTLSCPPPYVPYVQTTTDQRQRVDGFFRGLSARSKKRSRK